MATLVRLSQQTVNLDSVLLIRHFTNATNAAEEYGCAVLLSGHPHEVNFWGADADKLMAVAEALEVKVPWPANKPLPKPESEPPPEEYLVEPAEPVAAVEPEKPVEGVAPVEPVVTEPAQPAARARRK